MSAKINCQQCGTQLHQAKKVNRSLALQLVGVVLFCIGFVLLFFIPIGTVIGVVLMLGSLGLGYSRKNIWKCGNCGYFFERA